MAVIRKLKGENSNDQFGINNMLVFKVIENDSVGKRWGYFFY